MPLLIREAHDPRHPRTDCTNRCKRQCAKYQNIHEMLGEFHGKVSRGGLIKLFGGNTKPGAGAAHNGDGTQSTV